MKTKAGDVVLAVEHLSKSFLGQRALSDASLDVRAGEVHALLGENGSGKSTLIKCLAGYHHADPGAKIEVAGRELQMPYAPSTATEVGMAFVHQDLGLVPNLSVAENFALPAKFGTPALGRVPWRRIEKVARQHLLTLGHDIPPRALVGGLSIAEQTIVAIARALASAEEGIKVLVLDEPTAALPDARRDATRGGPNEVDLLFSAIRKVTSHGVGVIYVSHKLHEILALADRATVLRDGRRVVTSDVPGLSENDLVRLIVGHEVAARARAVQPSTGQVAIELGGVSGRRLRDIDLRVREGEVVGVAGMLGSGRSELARILTGAQRPAQGTVSLAGEVADLRSPRDAVSRGVCLVPEDRRRDGGLLEASVAQNLTLPRVGELWKRGRMDRRAEAGLAADLIERFHIHPQLPDRRFGVLSGGNQQKVVIAKWLSTRPKVMVFDEPVQGVDVGARADIYELIRIAAADGTAVVVVSSELEQLIDVCSRIVVLRNGRVVADLDAARTTRQQLTHLIYFGAPERSKSLSVPARPGVPS